MSSRIITAVAVVLMLAANDATARQWYVEPFVGVAAGFEDNPFLVTDRAADLDDELLESENFENQGFGYIEGSIRLGSESSSDLIAFDAFASTRRFDDSVLDTERILSSLLYEKSGLVNDWGVETGYLKSSSVDSIIRGDTGETLLPGTFGRFREDIESEDVFIRPSLTSRFSPSMLGEFDLSYAEVSFNDPTAAFTEFEETRGSAVIHRTISERMNGLGIVNFVFYRPTESVEVGDLEKENSADIQLGLDYRINERFLTSFSVGPGYVKSFINGFDGTTEISDTATAYNAGLDYTGERNTFSIVASSGFEAYIDGGLSNTQRLSIAYGRTETLGGDLSLLAAYVIRDPRAGDIEENDYYVLNSGLSWDIDRYLSLSLNILYRGQEVIDSDSGLTNRADTTAVSVGARYDWGRKYIKR